jgi:16S rRNA (cytosine1407-C5)-methyltransferase
MSEDRLERYRRLLDPNSLAALHEAVQRPVPSAIRVNNLHIEEPDARAIWPDRYGWTIDRVPFCPIGWQITGQEHRLSDTIEYDNGDYYIQDAASLLPPELFSRDVERPLILDLAAAPGGKTAHIAARFEDHGLILANDSSNSRLTALRANLQTQGIMGAMITNFPGEQIGRWFPELFDKALLDAPCSGDTLRESTGSKKRFVSDRERAQLCQRQSALLQSAFFALRPGGEIVYSTCTLAPEEDEGVIDELLHVYPNAARISAVEHIQLNTPGLAADGDTVFHGDLRHAFRLWPHLYRTSGFFAARIQKTESVELTEDEPPMRGWNKPRLSAKERSAFADSLRSIYGFDLDRLIEAQELTLWQHEKSIYAVPEQLLAHFEALPHMAAGFLIGQEVGDRIAPSHELVARFYSEFSGSRFTIDANQSRQWMQGNDLHGLSEIASPTGTVLLLQDELGRFLGRGKLLPDRIRNLRPKRLKG